ncbi:unnamed protein product, partial [marine sediment metagenome]
MRSYNGTVPEPPLPTHAQDRRRLDALLSRAWALAEEKDHPLGRLQGITLGRYRLLALLGPKNNVGAREGPRKLQGFKPLNEALARERTEA